MDSLQALIDWTLKEFPQSDAKVIAILLKAKELQAEAASNERHVWLNMVTGEFSNSWRNEHNIEKATLVTNNNTKNHIKLIKYECLNDNQFEFYNQMKLK